MCRLWLTSEHAEAYDLYLLHPAPWHGGQTPIVDIWGISYGETEIYAQVTTSSDTCRIKSKEDKLISLNRPNASYIVFANYMFDSTCQRWGKDRYRISLSEVWNSLYDGTKEQREKMQELCQMEYKQTK